MNEDEKERQADGGGEGVCVGYAPGQSGQQHEEGEEIRERGIGAVVGIRCFCGLGRQPWTREWRGLDE